MKETSSMDFLVAKVHLLGPMESYIQANLQTIVLQVKEIINGLMVVHIKEK